MWPFRRKHPEPDTGLIGQWRLDKRDSAALANYGDHAMTFTSHGELVYMTIADPEISGRVLLVYSVEGSLLITDQPSDPRQERTVYRIHGDRLLLGEPPVILVRDHAESSDPLAGALALGTAAIEHGLGSAHPDSAFVPFLMTQTASGRQLYRFVTDTAEEANKAAHARFRELRREIEVSAWVYDGYLTVGQDKFDAVLAELSSRRSPTGLLLAQPYAIEKFPAKRVAPLQTREWDSWFTSAC
ncbi:MAG: hypothetical protein AB1714_16480 [Acidobacteriota bacterium]